MTARFSSRRFAASSVLVVAFSFLLAGVVSGASAKPPVSATITPGALTILVSDGAFTFDNVDVNDTPTTPGDATGGTQPTVAVDGDVTLSSLTAAYANPTEATGCGWAGDTTADSDRFVMKVTLGFGSTGQVTMNPNGGTAIEMLNVSFQNSDGTKNLDFQMTMPTAITSGNTSCEIVITITGS